MSHKQKNCLWLGIAVIVLMGLFPPWMLAYPQGGYVAAGYSFILAPPNITVASYASKLSELGIRLCRIDVPHLCVQWAMVAVVIGGLLVTLKDKKVKDD